LQCAPADRLLLVLFLCLSLSPFLLVAVSVIEVGTVKFAMIGMMKSPPSWAVDIARTHFCLHRNNILKQAKLWAEKNAEVARLIPQLEEALNKQTLPDGTRPVLEGNETVAAPVVKPVKKYETRSSAAAAASSSSSS
jgi:hypothetical protein